MYTFVHIIFLAIILCFKIFMFRIMIEIPICLESWTLLRFWFSVRSCRLYPVVVVQMSILRSIWSGFWKLLIWKEHGKALKDIGLVHWSHKDSDMTPLHNSWYIYIMGWNRWRLVSNFLKDIPFGYHYEAMVLSRIESNCSLHRKTTEKAPVIVYSTLFCNY